MMGLQVLYRGMNGVSTTTGMGTAGNGIGAAGSQSSRELLGTLTDCFKSCRAAVGKLDDLILMDKLERSSLVSGVGPKITIDVENHIHSMLHEFLGYEATVTFENDLAVPEASPKVCVQGNAADLRKALDSVLAYSVKASQSHNNETSTVKVATVVFIDTNGR